MPPRSSFVPRNKRNPTSPGAVFISKRETSPWWWRTVVTFAHGWRGDRRNDHDGESKHKWLNGTHRCWTTRPEESGTPQGFLLCVFLLFFFCKSCSGRRRLRADHGSCISSACCYPGGEEMLVRCTASELFLLFNVSFSRGGHYALPALRNGMYSTRDVWQRTSRIARHWRGTERGKWLRLCFRILLGSDRLACLSWITLKRHKISATLLLSMTRAFTQPLLLFFTRT